MKDNTTDSAFDKAWKLSECKNCSAKILFFQKVCGKCVAMAIEILSNNSNKTKS